MSIYIRYITILLVVATVMTGCSIFNNEDRSTQEYEVLDEPREVSAQEAVEFIESGSGARSHGAAHQPINAQSGRRVFTDGDAAGSMTIAIRPGESLWHVARRLAFASNYTRVIYDFTINAPSPDQIVLKSGANTQNPHAVLAETAEIFSTVVPGLSLRTAYDGEGIALVVTDKNWHGARSIEIFDVRKGMLRDNASRLATHLGWEMDPAQGWLVANHYAIHTDYPLVVSADDVRQSFINLLEKYPAHALLELNTQNVQVVDRTQPRNASH